MINQIVIIKRKMSEDMHARLVAMGLAPPGPIPPARVFPLLEEEQYPIVDIEGDLGRMLTWEDIPSWYMWKFTTGRTFGYHGVNQDKMIEFYRRIFYAYPKEVREGDVEYDLHIHLPETNCYEAQLRKLEELVEEEKNEKFELRFREVVIPEVGMPRTESDYEAQKRSRGRMCLPMTELKIMTKEDRELYIGSLNRELTQEERDFIASLDG